MQPYDKLGINRVAPWTENIWLDANNDFLQEKPETFQAWHGLTLTSASGTDCGNFLKKLNTVYCYS